MRNTLTRTWCAVALCVAGCARIETPQVMPEPVRLRIVADQAGTPLAQALADAYAAGRPYATVVVDSMSTSGALDLVYSGQTDFAIISQLLPVPDGKIPPWVGDIAQDGVAVIVHAQNPIDGLSLFELREVFAGARSRWSDVGQPKLGDVDLAMRDATIVERRAFDAVVMNPVAPSLNAIVLPSVEVMANFVAARPGAIGYVPASRLKQLGRGVKAIAVEGQPPAADAIASGAYRLSYRLYLVAPFEPQWEPRKLALWALNSEGQAAVAGASFVPISSP